MTDLKELTLDELTDFMITMGEPKFRAKQIYEWIHVHNARSFEDMTSLSLKLRSTLEDNCTLNCLTVNKKLTSSEDKTAKYLLGLNDGNLIEAVLMRYHHGNSICISSQAGCRMGCRFCASGIGGLSRNLRASEMLDEVYSVEHDSKERISNIVVMGTGEPLDNYDEIIRFLKLISDENGRNISQRNITVSTCGLVPMVERLADEGLKITLAISLHATTDEIRKSIMPIANSYTLSQIFDACGHYFEKTGRRISFEYALFKGINDSMDDANRLIDIAKKGSYHINLIPANPVKELGFERTSKERVAAIKSRLEAAGVNVTLRRTLGADIAGACGQLRAQNKT